MRRLIKVSAYIAVVGLAVTASLTALAPASFAEKTAKASSMTKKSDEQKTAKYVGSSETKKYHRASCEFVKKIAKGHRVEFGSPAQAEKAGYTPCKVCTPSVIMKKSTKVKSGTTSSATGISEKKSATTKTSPTP